MRERGRGGHGRRHDGPDGEGAPRWLRWGIALLPRDFRERYGEEIEDVALRRMSEGRTAAPREGLDLVRTLVREWLTEVGQGVRRTGTGGREPMGTLLQDLRYAVRMLKRTPVVSTIAALSLALGIAATAASLALYDGFLRRGLSWPEADRAVNIAMSNPQAGAYAGGITPAVYSAIEPAVEGFEAVTWLENETTNLVEPDIGPEQVDLVIVGADFHRVVGADPLMGRGFSERDGDPGTEPVVILTHGFWTRRYGADPGVIGRQVRMSGRDHTVIGVMPQGFEMVPATADLLRAGSLDSRENDHGRALMVIGLPRPGQSPERIQEELRAIYAGVIPADPDAYEGWGLDVVDLTESLMGPQDRTLVMMLVAVALFGLLIACANVANLLLGRAEERQREVSVRTALGAGRGRIIAQLLTESLLLATVGGALGLGFSVLVVDWFALSMPTEVPQSMYPQLSPFVLTVSTAVTLVAGVIFGLAPALHAARADLRDTLTGGRGGTAGRRRRRLRNGFVIAEFAVAVGLLTGATMLVQTLGQIAGGDPGFREDGVTTFTLRPLVEDYPEGAQRVELRARVVDALREQPELRTATALSQLPRAQIARVTGMRVSGAEVVDEEIRPSVGWVAASQDYLATFDIGLVEGRWIAASDGAEGEPVAVVTRRFAEIHFPGERAVGRSIVLDRDAPEGEGDARPRRIVGVVEDVALQRLQIATLPEAAVYLPETQVDMRTTWFAVLAAADGTSAARAIRAAVASVDPTLPVGDVRTMEQHVDQQLGGPRLIAGFVGGVGIIALVLAALGIYGVMAHSVVQRTREIGIRMAMGAERLTVMGMVARTGVGLVVLGLLAGLPLAWLMNRVATSAIGDVTEVFPLWQTGVTVAALLGSVAVVACIVPAVRASAIQPTRALARE